jgi:hypothetical protein
VEKRCKPVQNVASAVSICDFGPPPFTICLQFFDIFMAISLGHSCIPISREARSSPLPGDVQHPPIERGRLDSSKRRQPLKIAALGPTMTPCLRRHLRGVMWQWLPWRSVIAGHCLPLPHHGENSRGARRPKKRTEVARIDASQTVIAA